MSIHRSRLEAGAHPHTDPRRGPELRADLERLAQSLTPRWRPTRGQEDFGYALLRIGARLAEQSTLRLDDSARRDALAFFDFLGLPPGPPRSATGVLVLALDPRRLTAVHAPARTQVAVTIPNGGQETFETQARIRLVPGGITELYGVDPAADRIDRAPAQVTSVAPPPDRPSDYRMVTFTGTGSRTLQLSPTAGIEEHDLLEVGNVLSKEGPTVHQVQQADQKTGLVTLVGALEHAASAGTLVRRVSAFRAFTLPNLQRHALFIGHPDQLNLEQLARITLHLSPASLAKELTELDIEYSLYGTPKGKDRPDWYPLEKLGVSGPQVSLAKTWPGPVNETKVNGQENRWIRARLLEPIPGRASATTRAMGVRLTVSSIEDDTGPDNQAPPQTPERASDAKRPRPVEGSRTVALAAHNGTPLATTRRFYPFGPEPIRFDTFALAAPEALSKKGATATLDITLADSSMEAFGVSTTATTKHWRGFGVGRNGYLQVVLNDGNQPRWLESRMVADDGRQILLDSGVPPVAVERTPDSDVVVLVDRDGELWSGIVQHMGSPPAVKAMETLHPIARDPNPGTGQRPEPPLITAAPAGAQGITALLLDVREGTLHSCHVNSEAKPGESWSALSTPTGGALPRLSTPGQLVAIQGAQWPQRPQAIELLARDDQKAVWIGKVSKDQDTEGLHVTWSLLQEAATGIERQVPPARMDVVPTATRFIGGDGKSHVWVCFAVGDGPGICGLDVVERDDGFEVRSIEREEDITVEKDSVLHTNPAIRGLLGLPTVVGLGPARESLFIWQWTDTVQSAVLPGKASSQGLQLVRRSSDQGSGHEILVPASGERILRAQLAVARIEYSLHNQVVMNSEKDWAPHRLFIASDFEQPETSTMIDLKGKNPLIYARAGHRHIRVFTVDSEDFALRRKFRFLRLVKVEPKDDSPVRSFKGSLADPTEPVPPPDGSGPMREPDPVPRTRLRLDEDDTHTAIGSRIVIGQAVYVVTEITETEGDGELETEGEEGAVPEEAGPRQKIATLNVPVTGDPGTYFVADEFTKDDGVFTADHKGTLVRLEAPRIPSELVFPEQASPRVQTVLRAGRGRHPVWAQLSAVWRTQPADGTVEIPEEGVGWTETVRGRDYRNPELSLEYFDGRTWRTLTEDFRDSTDHLSTSGIIRFTVPEDLAVTEIGGKEDYWIRARLIGGDYGRPTYRVTTTEQPAEEAKQGEKEGEVTTQSIVVDTSQLNPPEILSIEASFSGLPPTAPTMVLAENNGEVLDQTQATIVPSASFQPFQGAAAIDPRPSGSGRALIAGLTGPVGAGPMTLFVDADDQPGSGTLQVEVMMPDGWRRVAVDDQSASLRRRGLVRMSFDTAPVPLRLFGQDRVWLRLRPGEDAVPGTDGDRAADSSWAPVVHMLLPNAVSISHARTMGNEILGTSLGAPATTVYLPLAPVLPDSVDLRVREDLSDEERTALGTEHRARADRTPGAAGLEPVSELDGVPGKWVLWNRVDSLIGQSRDARVYVLEPRTGRITFGDDLTGRIPPAGRDGIRCFSYQQGGGAAGNVSAWSETKMTTAVEGVQSAVLPVGAAGGADPPPAETVFTTAPHQLRHTGRALTPADVETLAVASSGEVLKARCLRPAAAGEPVRIAVLVKDENSRRPQPTHSQRDAVSSAVRAAGWGGLDGDAVQVSAPTYIPIAVTAHLIGPPESWADIEQAARDRLVGFFDPASGGPHGTGWAFGRRPNTSDLLRELHQIRGISRIAAVKITPLDDSPEHAMPGDGMVCAEVEDIMVTVSGEGSMS